MDTLSTSPVSTILAPPGFTPIGPPGSLATPPVIMDTLYLGISLRRTAGVAAHPRALSPCRVQPIVDEASAVRHTLSSSISIPAVDSPVESDLTGSSSPMAATVPDVSSSPVVSSSCWSSHRLLSPDLMRLDRSLYSATDSPTGQVPAMHPEPTFDPSVSGSIFCCR